MMKLGVVAPLAEIQNVLTYKATCWNQFRVIKLL